jgi:hypothetical protein
MTLSEVWNHERLKQMATHEKQDSPLPITAVQKW